MGDYMTGRERVEAALHFQETDRVAVFPLNYYQASRVLGITIREYASSGKSISDTAVAGARYYGYDAVQIGTDVAVEGGACGSQIEQPEDSPAFVKVPVIQDESDLDSLEVPDPKKSDRMNRIIEGTARCKEEIGHQIMVCSNAMGPLNLAAQLRGVQTLLMDIIEDPEFFEQLLDFSVEVCLVFGKALVDAGADMICFGEALCSPNVISPGIYRQYVLPRQQKVLAALKAYGMPYSILHVCGKVDPILADLGRTGCDCLDIDSMVDMNTAKTVSGLAVRGNLAPSGILMNGTPEQVENECKKLILSAGKGGGLILGTGCCAAPDTPHSNILAIVEASKKYSCLIQ